MVRTVILSFAALLLCACPEKTRQEQIEQVGGAPKRQLDDVHQRLDAAGAREREAHEKADKATEEP